MVTVEVIFGRSYLPISLGIQIRTWSKWSHVGLLINGYVYEARGGFGVVKTSLRDFKKRYRETEIRKLDCPNDGVVEAIKSKLGYSYDRRSFWGIAFGVDLDELCAYQCAELIGKYSGNVFDKKYSSIVPKDIYRKTYAIS